MTNDVLGEAYPPASWIKRGGKGRKQNGKGKKREKEGNKEDEKWGKSEGEIQENNIIVQPLESTHHTFATITTMVRSSHYDLDILVFRNVCHMDHCQFSI